MTSFARQPAIVRTLAIFGAALLLLAAVEAAAQNTAKDAGGQVPRMSLDSRADSGDPFASFIAGRHYLIGASNSSNPTDREKGLRLIAQAADAGFAPAARFAGALFLDGKLLPLDVDQAVVWFTRAAKLGDVAAQLDLGDLLSDGALMTPNLAQAAIWYETALSNPAADYRMSHLYDVDYRLGKMYAVGDGVGQDPIKARTLWQRAADKVAYPPALKALAEAQANGVGGRENRKAALATYQAAARAYRDAGIRFDIGPEVAHREVSDILATVQRMKARGKIVRRVQMEMDRIVVP